MGNLARRIVGIILCILGCLGYIFFLEIIRETVFHNKIYFIISVSQLQFLVVSYGRLQFRKKRTKHKFSLLFRSESYSKKYKSSQVSFRAVGMCRAELAAYSAGCMTRQIYFKSSELAVTCTYAAKPYAETRLGSNASGYDDKTYVAEIDAKGKIIEDKTIAMEKEILAVVNEKIGV